MGSVFDPYAVIICIYPANKFSWFDFAYGLVYPVLVVACDPKG